MELFLNLRMINFYHIQLKFEGFENDTSKTKIKGSWLLGK